MPLGGPTREVSVHPIPIPLLFLFVNTRLRGWQMISFPPQSVIAAAVLHFREFTNFAFPLAAVGASHGVLSSFCPPVHR